MDQAKIDRFKNFTEADPTNELAFFSLGRAYMDNGEPKLAVPALQRVIALNAGFSKAYALLGTAQHASGDDKDAIETLTTGYRIANDRGDLMPRNDMAALLKELGAPIPEMGAQELKPEDAAAGKIRCARCGRVSAKMAQPPFGGELGAKIHGAICAPCFAEWVAQGTKVINELRLNLTEKPAQDAYDQHMREFLHLP